jgi:hypothetical protein
VRLFGTFCWRVWISQIALLPVNGFTFYQNIVIPQKKMRFSAGELASGLPKSLPLQSQEKEEKIIRFWIAEINKVFGFNLDPKPNQNRTSGEKMTSGSGRKYVTIGASHAKRIAGGLQKMGCNIIDLEIGGWSPDPTNVIKLTNDIKKLQLGGEDVVIADLLSNSAFCGTDDSGFPKRISKGSDGKYHVPGDITLATEKMVETVLEHCLPVLEAVKNTQLILITPIPQYISSKCCENPAHVTNFQCKNMQNKIVAGLEVFGDLLHRWVQSGTENYSVLDCAAVLSPTGMPLTEVAIDSGRLWPLEDPVHFRAGGFGIIAKAIMATETEAGDQLEPEPKRRRLESVVVRVVWPEVMPAPVQ